MDKITFETPSDKYTRLENELKSINAKILEVAKRNKELEETNLTLGKKYNEIQKLYLELDSLKVTNIALDEGSKEYTNFKSEKEKQVNELAKMVSSQEISLEEEKSNYSKIITHQTEIKKLTKMKEEEKEKEQKRLADKEIELNDYKKRLELLSEWDRMQRERSKPIGLSESIL
jgi:hypothetical protein